MVKMKYFFLGPSIADSANLKQYQNVTKKRLLVFDTSSGRIFLEVT